MRIYRDLILGMMIPYYLMKLFDRRLRQLSSAILNFGGHLGFSGMKITIFTKITADL